MRVGVIGAGLAGLVAARRLAERHTVVVFDKGRSVGGRLATRRIGVATFDHGAQFFTVRGAALQAQVDDWLDRGIARVWCHGFEHPADGYPRYIGTAGMNSLAKDLAGGLDVRLQSFVFTIRDARDDSAEAPAWDLVIDDGAEHRFDAMVLTCPVPQSWSLLAQSGVAVPESMIRGAFARTLAALVVLDSPSAIPAPGAIQFLDTHPVFSFVADNDVKGVSAVPALTLHANAAWSSAHWDESNKAVLDQLLSQARPWFADASVVHAELKRWRLATPLEPWPDRCWIDPDHRVALAGDAFAGPKFEAAYVSGVAAAVELSTVLAGGGA